MILTCPACDTKYVVKDGAIPAAGRQVRCASCKHSWHQDAEPALVERESVAVDFGGPPPPGPDASPEPVAEIPEQAAAEAMIAGEPQPEVGTGTAADYADEAEWHPVDKRDYDDFRPVPTEAPDQPQGVAEMPEMAEPPERREQPEQREEPEQSEWQAPAPPPEEEFVGYAPIASEEERQGRRWPLLLVLLLIVVAAAAAFWFLAPAEWKARAGIPGAAATPLQLMITTSDRQPLESGNELVAISGRVINPTDQEQNVPPIRAELRDKQTNAVVHRWTIAPPARVLAPRSSASFNSAEVDVPKGGDELTVTLGG